MNKESRWETVASHLTKGEADRMRRVLTSAKINAIISGHDAASRYSTLYYLIRVSHEDLGTAQRIIARERANISGENRKCPRCGYLGYREIKKNGLLDKLYYLGTTLVECKKCRHRFGI